jgi:hypothetical protein
VVPAEPTATSQTDIEAVDFFTGRKYLQPLLRGKAAGVSTVFARSTRTGAPWITWSPKWRGVATRIAISPSLATSVTLASRRRPQRTSYGHSIETVSYRKKI